MSAKRFALGRGMSVTCLECRAVLEMLAVCALAGAGSFGAVDAGAAGPGAGAVWWNADWACRAKLTVDSGFYKRQDLLLSQINFDDWLKKAGVEGAFDAKSPRVLWLHGGERRKCRRASFPLREARRGECCSGGGPTMT